MSVKARGGVLDFKRQDGIANITEENMRKKHLYLLAPAALTLFLASCGSQTSTTTAPESSAETTSAADQSKAESSIGNENYIYGKLNIPYADYYYGEINDIEPEADPAKLTPQLDKEDPITAAGLREAGQYDSVSSSTAKKAASYKTVYSETVGEGSQINGVINVNVAISKKLYEEAKKAAEANTEAKNPLLTFVAALTDTTDTTPAEYKVLNSDGVFSKTVGTTNKAEGAKAEITTTSSYGNYQIDIEGLELKVDNVQGVVLETKEGKKYGLEHLENIWLTPTELAFAAAPFTEVHNNAVDYLRYADIPGKTITKITYLIQDDADIEIDTDLLCKQLAPENFTITGDEQAAYSKEGTKVNYTLTAEGSEYKLARVIYRRKDVEDISSITAQDGVITLPKENVPGQYQFVFSNDQYADLSFNTVIDSGLSAGDFSFADNTLRLKENDKGLDIKTYINSTTSATVNETEYKGGKGRKFGTAIFNEDGSIKLDATTTSDGKDVPVFEAAGTYTVTIKAAGYPDVTFEVTK